MSAPRAHWGSRIGFVLAAAGSAVGLGNLWKFPYIAWNNQGGSFLIVYFLAVTFLGLPVMIAEISVGRRAQLSAAHAYAALGGRAWGVLGWVGVLAAGVIQSYYLVIAGWSLHSLGECLGWSVGGYVSPVDGAFSAFLANGPLQLAFTAAFSFLTSAVLFRGVSGGIELLNRWAMPLLFALLIYLVGTALTLDGALAGVAALWTPQIQTFRPAALLEASGQAFFSLSLGLGAMVTYGSYLKREDSIPRAALAVVILDTVVAVLAATLMFILLYAIPGLAERVSGSTVGMLFVTLPELFYTKIPGGIVLAPAFFALVAIAAVTSTISLGEVLIAAVTDTWGIRRDYATVATGVAVFAGSALAALSLGAVPALSEVAVFAGKAGVLSTLDHLASNYLLPLGGIGTSIFVGWFWAAKDSRIQLALPSPLFLIWLWSVRVVAPAAIFALLIAVALGKDFS